MNYSLYLVCKEYCKCFELLDTLIKVDGIKGEQLKLFRLTDERADNLEDELVSLIVKGELENNQKE